MSVIRTKLLQIWVLATAGINELTLNLGKRGINAQKIIFTEKILKK